MRSGAPLEVLENLQEIEDEGDVYESIEDIWPDYPTKEDFLFNEDEYWSLIVELSRLKALNISDMRISTWDSHIAFFGLLPPNKLAKRGYFGELNDQ